MRFSTSEPVVDKDFFNRKKEINLLLEAINDLKKGNRRFYALMGPRKVGKSSILKQLHRLSSTIKDVNVVTIDCYRTCISTEIFFEELAVQIINEFLIKTGYSAKTGLLSAKWDKGKYLLTISNIQGLKIKALQDGLEAVLNITGVEKRAVFEAIVNLPEKLAHETNTYFLLIFDEFQECTKLDEFKITQQTIGSIFKFLRSYWQQHKKVNYFISGSEISLLQKIIMKEESAFFQHFNIMNIGEFDAKSAQEMIDVLFKDSGYILSPKIKDKLLALTHHHPFYLQVLGEELCKASDTQQIKEDTFKGVVQSTIFDNSGRLYLYFNDYFNKYIRSAALNERVLVSLAKGNLRVSQIAKDLKRTNGEVGSWLNRLVDIGVIRKREYEYEFCDPLFKLWIKGVKSELRTIIGPFTIGSEVEKKLALQLAQMGFRLVYQSRASRGIFDILVLLNSFEIGLQIKSIKKYPVYLTKNQYTQMYYWAEQLGWLPILCLYQEKIDKFKFYQLKDLKFTGKYYKVDKTTISTDNLLEIV